MNGANSMGSRDEDIGEMKADIKNLCRSVDKLSDNLEKTIIKMESKDNALEERVGIVEKKQVKTRGFVTAMALMFPMLTGFILYIAKFLGGSGGSD